MGENIVLDKHEMVVDKIDYETLLKIAKEHFKLLKKLAAKAEREGKKK